MLYIESPLFLLTYSRSLLRFFSAVISFETEGWINTSTTVSRAAGSSWFFALTHSYDEDKPQARWSEPHGGRQALRGKFQRTLCPDDADDQIDGKTMLVGADVGHPPQGKVFGPSIAVSVAGINVDNTLFKPAIRLQEGRT